MNPVTPILIAAILTSTLVAAESWQQLGGPGRNFTVADQGLADSWPENGPKVLWRRELGDGYSGIVHADGVLYTQHREGSRDVLVSLEAETGRTLWSSAWQAPAASFMDTEFGPGPHSTPLVAGERVFAVGVTGRLVVVDRDSGRLLWKRELWSDLGGTPLERGYAASPVAYRGLVIVPVGGEQQAVVAFRQSDGTVAWQAEGFDVAYSSPILAEVEGETQLIALLETEIVGIDPADGRRQWLLPVSDERYVNVVTPLFTDGNLLFFDSSEGGRVLRLRRQAGVTELQQLWIDKVIGSQVGNVVRIGDYLYGANGRSAASFMSAVHITTGEQVWRTREIGNCTLLVAGNKVIVLESDGTLRLVRLSPEGLEPISQTQVLSGRSWTPPTLIGTTLYLRNRREMVALDLAAAKQ